MNLETNLAAIHVGLPQLRRYGGREIFTGIKKERVSGQIAISREGLAGDDQGDPSVHGGPDKAIYAYSFANIIYWREALERPDFDTGTLGENLSLEDLPERAVRIGDVFRTGSAVLQVSQPREPCQTLSLKLGLPDFPKRFMESGRVGFYLRVLEIGEVGEGDAFTRIETDPRAPSIHDLNHAYHFDRGDPEVIACALANPALSPAWRKPLEERLP